MTTIFTRIEFMALMFFFFFTMLMRLFQVWLPRSLQLYELFFIFCCKELCGVLYQSTNEMHSISVPFAIIGVEKVKKLVQERKSCTRGTSWVILKK